MVSSGAVERTADTLRRVRGMAVTVHSVPGKAHAMPQGPSEMRMLMQFWAQHLSRRPMAAGGPSWAGEVLPLVPLPGADLCEGCCSCCTALLGATHRCSFPACADLPPGAEAGEVLEVGRDVILERVDEATAE